MRSIGAGYRREGDREQQKEICFFKIAHPLIRGIRKTATFDLLSNLSAATQIEIASISFAKASSTLTQLKKTASLL